MEDSTELGLEKSSLSSPPDVLHGVIVDDPGTPCTQEYARELTERALQLSDELDGTLQEIVRVKAWEPLGYPSPDDYVKAEFTQTSRAHRYRLARFAAFIYELTERIGDEALDLKISERILRQIPSSKDAAVINALERNVAQADEEQVDEAVAGTMRAHSRNATPEDDMWAATEDPAEPSHRQSGGRPSAPADDGWGHDEGEENSSEVTEASPGAVHAEAPEVSKSDLAEAARYSEFVRAMRVIAATGGELPGILDNADESEEQELLELAEQVSAVATATGEALNYA